MLRMCQSSLQVSKIHFKFHVSQQEFSNMVAAVLPANQMPGLKIFVAWNRF